ncbi:MAG: phytoene desaturase [Candidatus Aminicenantes bacterium]|nr:phytoene desaturase [Candidatus Aminicenantes bacterium]
MSRRAVVIGAGLGGLATAALLGREGWEVTVVEKNEEPGGRARVWRSDGFLFDMGPSWYLMPEAFDRYFALHGTSAADRLRLVRLDPQFRVFYGGGGVYDVRDALADNAALFDRLEPEGASKTARFLAKAREQYDLSVRHFLYRDYDGIAGLLGRDIVRNGLRLGVFGSVHDLVAREIQDERLQQILEFAMVFIGGDPKKTPGFYALMSSIVLDRGVWYPLGGISEIVRALVELGRDQGVRFAFGHPARRIRTAGGRAVEVVTDRESHPADAVIANADYHHVETALLEGPSRSYRGRYWSRRVLSPSAFILYVGLDRRLDGIVHHNLFFEKDWNAHFDAVFRRPAWPDRFSYYVSCPSKTDPAVAPDGAENLFFLVPVAPGLDDPDGMREAFADKVLEHFEGLIGGPVRKHVTVRRIFSPRDFVADYNTYKGTAFGLSHTLFQTASFRPRRKSRRVDNLYFTGQYPHPGVGMPMVMIGAELTADRVVHEQG